MRLRVLLFAVLSACSAAKADPSPMPPERPRIELRTVKQNFSTIIGAYIRDNEIKVPVAPAQAEDGKQRWLLIEDWPVCESCIQGNPSHCGSNPARCYQPAGSKSGCCV